MKQNTNFNKYSSTFKTKPQPIGLNKKRASEKERECSGSKREIERVRERMVDFYATSFRF